MNSLYPWFVFKGMEEIMEFISSLELFKKLQKRNREVKFGFSGWWDRQDRDKKMWLKILWPEGESCIKEFNSNRGPFFDFEEVGLHFSGDFNSLLKKSFEEQMSEAAINQLNQLVLNHLKFFIGPIIFETGGSQTIQESNSFTLKISCSSGIPSGLYLPESVPFVHWTAFIQEFSYRLFIRTVMELESIECNKGMKNEYSRQGVQRVEENYRKYLRSVRL